MCTHLHSGVLCMTAGRKVLSVSLNEQNLVPFVMKVLNNRSLALKLSSRLNLPGADDMYTQQFERFLLQVTSRVQLRLLLDLLVVFFALRHRAISKMPQRPVRLLLFFSTFRVLLKKGRLNNSSPLSLPDLS